MDIKKLEELNRYTEGMTDEELLEMLVDMTLVNERRITKLERSLDGLRREVKVLKIKLNTRIITFEREGE